MINFEKKSVLNLEVSYFKNIKSVDPITVNLLNILENCEHKSLVEKLRNSNDDFEKAKIKRSIGCISPSGIFSHRNINFLVKHSGLIVFDIDLKDNLHISNYSELREEISKISNVAYVALSVSGKGYWGLIPISDAKKHKLFFKEIEKVFKSYGIVIDPSGSDVTRLRILSYDPSAYFNHNAITLSQYGAEESKKIGKIPNTDIFASSNNSPEVNALISLVLICNIDITNGYMNWFTLGCFFNNLKDGNILFHRISFIHKDYNKSKTERHFRNCEKYSKNYTIGSFIKICKDYGISICKGYMVCYRDSYELIGKKIFQVNEKDMFSFEN